MIGKKVRVFWPVDEQWYVGVVQQYDETNGEHELKYPDGDTEWVKIGDTPSNVAAREREQKQQAERERNLSKSSSNDPRSQGANNVGGQQYGSQNHSSRTSTISPDTNTSLHKPNHRFGTGPFNMQMSPQHGQDWQMSQQGNSSHHIGSTDSNNTNNDPANCGSSPHSVMPMTPQQPYPHQHMQQPTQGNSPGGRPQYGGMSMSPSHMYPPHHGHPGHHGMYNRHAYHPPHGYGYPHPGMQNGMGRNPSMHVESSKQSMSHISSSDNNDEAPNSSSKRKSGPKTWTKDEDALLLSMVQSMRMPMKWSIVAQSMPDRTGKQCRERYVNHLNPRLKSTDWNPSEDATIFHLYNSVGSQWAKMSKMIPGRTDNGIKNRFHNLRRQLEREDEHRLRLSKPDDFKDDIYTDRIRSNFPEHLRGKNDELWDMHRGIAILAAQSTTGGQSNVGAGITRNAGKFGPFRLAKKEGEQCVRCGLLAPSAQCGTEICETTKWCQSCTRIPPHLSGNLLRECLNLRRSDNESISKIIEILSLKLGEANDLKAITDEGKQAESIHDIESECT